MDGITQGLSQLGLTQAPAAPHVPPVLPVPPVPAVPPLTPEMEDHLNRMVVGLTSQIRAAVREEFEERQHRPSKIRAPVEKCKGIVKGTGVACKRPVGKLTYPYCAVHFHKSPTAMDTTPIEQATPMVEDPSSVAVVVDHAEIEGEPIRRRTGKMPKIKVVGAGLPGTNGRKTKKNPIGGVPMRRTGANKKTTASPPPPPSGTQQRMPLSPEYVLDSGSSDLSAYEDHGHY